MNIEQEEQKRTDRLNDLEWEITACTDEIEECKRDIIKHPNEGASLQRHLTYLETKRAAAREKRDALRQKFEEEPISEFDEGDDHETKSAGASG